jgi:hypothetical protein
MPFSVTVVDIIFTSENETILYFVKVTSWGIGTRLPMLFILYIKCMYDVYTTCPVMPRGHWSWAEVYQTVVF